MSTWGPAAAGRYWTTSTPGYAPLRTGSVAPQAPVDLGTVAISQAAAPLSADAVRQRLEPASAALRTAFAAFTSHTRPVFTTNVTTRPAVAAAFGGTAARTTPTAGTSAALSATVQVNTRSSAARASSTAIGLDLTSAHSRLSSAALGFDVISPESASTLSSASPLGLDLGDRATAMTSSAEMNGSAVSLGSSRLAFQGETSQLEISGAFTGAARSLTFRITSVPNFLLKNTKFDVLDENGNEVASYSGQVTSGQPISLAAIGLSVRFTEGTLSKGATATTTVIRTPTAVDTAARFDGAWGAAPLFENFSRVSAGSFQVNGVQIAVQSSDTIDSVLARIGASAAGVTGAVVDDRIVLTSKSASESSIVLGGDTSGFLQATKLGTASAAIGNHRDDQQILSQTTAFAGVQSGSFRINGVEIAVDRDRDTLAAIIARINDAAAGVSAVYDQAADRVVLQSLGSSEDAIEVSNDSSGFLSAAGLSTAATVRGNVRDDLQVLTKTTRFAAVTDGAFTVNGVTVAVDADEDSVASLVAKINAAGAGVTAVFNAVAGTIDLESDADSEQAIVLGDDSSGVLSAAGLQTDATVAGSIADDGQRLADTDAFAAVVQGSFEVNGVVIAVDPGTDSLHDVLARINSSGAGVTATYDAAADRITLDPASQDAALTLSADSSGFLAAAGLAAGTTGTRLNADAAFDGSGGSDPLFDEGVRVGPGTFSINGVSIDVAADDTVNAVLARISASAAGVSAAYDSSTDRVTLTATGSSEAPIDLGTDTSGFLAAVKLDGTATSSGGVISVDPYDGPLGRIAEYADVVSGVVTINGTDIVIDPSTTTLRGVLDAIAQAGGLSVSFDEHSGTVRIAATDASTEISLVDTSGLMAALGISAATYRGAPSSTTFAETQTGTEVVSNAHAVARAVEDAAAALSEVLTALAADRPDDPDFLDALVRAATDAVETLRDAGIGGLTVGGAESDVRVVVDRDSLVGALDRRGDAAGVSAVISAALDDLAARVADAAAAHAEDEPPPASRVNLGAASPQGANPALMYLQALARVVRAGTAAAEVSNTDSAADGALDMAARMKIRAGLEQPQADPAEALRGLLDMLVMDGGSSRA